MKALIWAIAALLALVWSVGIAMLSTVSGWLAGSADKALGGVREVGNLTLPPWLDVWLDPAWRDGLQAFVAWGAGALAWITPWIGPVLEWVAPLLWVFWGIGIVILLLAAAGTQFVIGKIRPARAAA